MASNYEWVIHGIGNHYICDECRKAGHGFFPQSCNFHTHGMERYGHKDFQMVLAYPVGEICRILNTLGERVRDGERFKDGDLISGIYLDCDVRVTEFEETGRTVLRVIIPDKHNRFPEDPDCLFPYTVQMFSTEFLSSNGVTNEQ